MSPTPVRGPRVTGAHAALVLASALVTGCARELPQPASGGTPRLATAYDPRATLANRIPGGKRCLQSLKEFAIRYRRSSAKRGVATPVEILGPIGGVRYTVAGKQSMLCDCRLALTLHWAAPALTRLGVTEVQASGAYVYRTTRSGRPSRHALGLAVDVHRFKFDANTLKSVKRDFKKGLGCTSDVPRVNRIACELRKLRLFRELITPDHNRDHHDHFHLAIGPR